jgi:preprotein translocase subunit YajC
MMRNDFLIPEKNAIFTVQKKIFNYKKLMIMFTPMVIMLQETATTTSQGGGMSMIIMMVLIFAVMWLFMIRPQQKQQKELAKFRNALEKGQKVMTAGGIYGVVKEVKETSVVLTVDKDVTLIVDKAMISRAPGETPAK